MERRIMPYPKISEAERQRQLAIGDEWLASHEQPKPPEPPKPPKKASYSQPRIAVFEKKRLECIRRGKHALLKLTKNEFVTRKQVAKALGVSESTVSYWAIKKHLPRSYRHNGQTVFKNTDLLEMLNQHK